MDPYRKRRRQKRITEIEANMIISQLINLREIDRNCIIEGPYQRPNTHSYFARHIPMIRKAEEFYAFQVNDSPGTQDFIDKVKDSRKPLTVRNYYF